MTDTHVKDILSAENLSVGYAPGYAIVVVMVTVNGERTDVALLVNEAERFNKHLSKAIEIVKKSQV